MRLFKAMILACVVLACTDRAARAQDTVSEYLDEYNEPFTALDVLFLTRRAGLNEDQRQMAWTVLEDCRASVVAAQRRMGRELWMIEHQSWDIDEAKRGEWQAKAERKQRSEYRDRLLAIEKETLASLRVLVDGHPDAWNRYLRNRRTTAYLVSGSFGGIPPVERIIDGLGLSTGERLALNPTIEEYLESLDAVVKDYLVTIRDYRRMSESDKGVSDDQERAINERRTAITVKLIETIDRGMRTIASMLPSEKTPEFQSRVDAAKTKRIVGEGNFDYDEVVRDVLRISTLTTEQRAKMRAIKREAEQEVARNFKELLPIYEAAATGRTTNQSSRSDELYSAASAASAPVLGKLREKLIAVLTEAQRRAFEEGVEPPLTASEEHWGEDLDRR